MYYNMTEAQETMDWIRTIISKNLIARNFGKTGEKIYSVPGYYSQSENPLSVLF